MSTTSEIIKAVRSKNDKEQLEGTLKLRELCTGVNAPKVIETLIQEDAGFRLIDFIKNKSSPLKLQLEAAWVMTNIASHKYIGELNRIGAIPTFVDLLHYLATHEHYSQEHDAIWKQGVWFLGNITANSLQCRDDLLDHGVLITLTQRLGFLLDKNNTSSMLHIVAWSMSNFCKWTPKPLFKKIKPMLPFLDQILDSNEEEVLDDVSWSLFVLSEGSNEQIQAVIDSGVCRRLVTLLKHHSYNVVIQVLLTVGNIVRGSEEQTQHIMNYDKLLPNLLSLLDENLQNNINFMSKEHVKMIRKETYWTISNITAGNKDQIQAVIDNKIIDRVLSSFPNVELDLKNEAIWVLSNATSRGDHDQIVYLVNKNCIKALCYMLGSRDARVVSACLEGLENILKVGEAEKNLGRTEDINLYVNRVKGAGGFDRIHPNLKNREVDDRVARIIDTYLLTEEDIPHLLFGNKYANWVVIIFVVPIFLAYLVWFYLH